MKKSLLILCALAVLGLTACGEKPTSDPVSSSEPISASEPASSSESSPTPTTVPTEAGKCTFYLELSEGSVSVPSYASIYLTGGAIDWKIGYDAIELEKLEGDNNIYYAQVDNDSFDATISGGTGYQLALGYNRSANLPDNDSGLRWAPGRKSDECEAYGSGNPSFVYDDGDLQVDLGIHTWSTELPEPPKVLSNYTIAVNFAEAVPDYASVLIFGSFDSWSIPNGDGAAQCAADHKMTPNQARTKWTFTIPQILPGSYECKVLVEYNTDVETGEIKWNAVDEMTENYPFTVYEADGDDYQAEIFDGAVHFDISER